MFPKHHPVSKNMNWPKSALLKIQLQRKLPPCQGGPKHACTNRDRMSHTMFILSPPIFYMEAADETDSPIS